MTRLAACLVALSLSLVAAPSFAADGGFYAQVAATQSPTAAAKEQVQQARAAHNAAWAQARAVRDELRGLYDLRTATSVEGQARIAQLESDLAAAKAEIHRMGTVRIDAVANLQSARNAERLQRVAAKKLAGQGRSFLAVR